MTLKELISEFKTKDILKRLIKLYPDQKKSVIGYINVLKELSKLKPKSDKMQILIEKEYDKYDKKSYLHVCAIDSKKQTYAIEFEPWNTWLGMEINPQSYKICSELDIICHCLYEMTFVGFSNEKVKQERNNLTKLLKDCKKKEEKK
ncbi:MAG: DUF6557 family protein [Clostridia bacterium]